jgi:hypothetical protein
MGRFDMLLPAALAAAALSGLAASPSFAAEKPAAPITAQQAIDLQDKFLHALYGTDLNAISALLSEDVTFTHPNGMALDKKGEMNLMSTGPLPRYGKLEQSNIKARIFPGAAVLTGDVTFTALPKEGAPPPTPNTYRMATAWADEEGVWRMVSWQLVAIAKPRAGGPPGAGGPPRLGAAPGASAPPAAPTSRQ